MRDIKETIKSFVKNLNPFSNLLEPQKIIYKDLKPIDYNEQIISSFEKKIERFLFQLLFSDLKSVLKEYNAFMSNVANSQTNVVRAIQEGKITYVKEGFKSNFKDGKFPIYISKAFTNMGATFNKQTKTFVIKQENLPKEIIEAVSSSVFDNFYFTRKLIEAVSQSQDQAIFDDLFEKAGFKKEYENILKDTINQINSNSFEIPVGLNEMQALQIVNNYTENLKITIKKFTNEQTLELRQMVEENTQAGFRPQVLANKISERFGVSQSKAKFLASQETRLLTSQYAMAKFTENNITDMFRWGRSASRIPDEFHKQYYNKTFSYKDLPVIDEATGERGLPGQRYNCKCRIIPVIAELEK